MSEPASLIAAAEKKLKGGFLSALSGGPKYEEASELYNQAANQYKLQTLWNEASGCFLKCSDCQGKQADRNQEAHFLVEAGHCLKRISANDSIVQYEKAAKIYNANGRYSQGAKLLLSIAEMMEQELDFPRSTEYYSEAAKFFDMDEYGKSNRSKCIAKYAELSARYGNNLAEATKIFVQEGTAAVQNQLLSFGAKEHFLKAGILLMAQGDAITASNACTNYSQIDPKFAGSREGKLLRELCTHYEADDVDAFLASLHAYDRISPIDAWKAFFLTKVKDSMSATAKAPRAAEKVTITEDAGTVGEVDLS